MNKLSRRSFLKGTGIATGAAISNAVADAVRPLGVTLTELPLSPDNRARWMREAMQKREAVKRKRRAECRARHVNDTGIGADDLREQMSGNLCRCGAYPNIVAAITRAWKNI